MKYKAVLLDYDGTMADSNKVILDSWQYMAGKLIGKELPMEELKKTFGLILRDAMYETAVRYSLPTDDASIENMMTVYRSYQKEKLGGNGYPAFDGMVDLVKRLKAAGVKLGIVTSRGLDSLEPGLKYIGLDGYFDYLVTLETTSIHKPEPAPALICCRGLDVAPEDSLIVGDSKYDIACGNNAGCGSCFVSWSFSTSKEEVESYSPADYYVDSAEEIFDIVNQSH